MHNKFLELAKSFPTSPGCYLMKNKEGKVIYVGKAKNLKSRVSSYFNNSVKNPKTEIMVGHVHHVEFMMTATDAEAFVLENNLIKKNAPKYNIRLRDDKTYPYVLINHKEVFPRLEYVRRPKRDKKVEVFGPFVGGNISFVLRILTKSFGLRDCSLHDFSTRKEPCLLYQMRQCTAPCVGKITTDDYNQNLELALSFFKSKEKNSEAMKLLEKRMLDAAENEDFEYAAILRDNLQLLKDFKEIGFQKNSELHGNEQNLDVISYYQGEIEIDLCIYMVRNGILLGTKTFHFSTAELIEEIEQEVLNYLFQYYANTLELLPELIIINKEEEVLKTFAEGLNQVLEKKIRVENPKRKFKDLFELSQKFAQESQRVRISNQESIYVGLNKLKDLLSLKEIPKTIECYDIAIWQGKSPTASQVCFIDGKPDKKKYRYYHLQERPEGNNDFAMMEEVIKRRIDNGDLPDLFVIDGGLGQVNAVKKVLTENKIEIPLVGIAKSKTKSEEGFQSAEIDKTEERLIIPGRANPYILAKSPSLFRLIVQLRDEAHRFSRKLHHKAEDKRLFGNKKKKNL